MYIPASFAETDVSVMIKFIEEQTMGLLISSGQNGLWVTPLPFMYQVKGEQASLVTHMARANLHWKDLLNIEECMVVFQGLHNYVTPNWYPSGQVSHKEVPTWNYEIVQVKGCPKVIQDEHWLKTQTGQLSDFMEKNREPAWSVADAPENFINAQLQAIVGLEIQISSMQGKWKVSQNKRTEDICGVVQGMSDSNDVHANTKMAKLIQSRMKK